MTVKIWSVIKLNRMKQRARKKKRKGKKTDW